MDRIPLINPKLIKVSATAEKAPTLVLRAEVISSTPNKESIPSQEHNNRQDEYKVVLKVGQQQLETISNSDFKKGSLLEVKLLPGPELKILTDDQKVQQIAQPAIPQTKGLVQQLLADRIPKIQQQELPNLIKQLSQMINPSIQGSSQTAVTSSPIASPPIFTHSSTQASSTTPQSLLPNSSRVDSHGLSGANLTNQQSLANQFYLQQGKPMSTVTEKTAPISSSTSTAVHQVKAWLQQLPKEQDISNSTGIRNALNNAGIQAEKQLSTLAQQSLNLADHKSANTIFQHLQSLQKSFVKESGPINNLSNNSVTESGKGAGNSSSNIATELKTDLASIVKRTAKTLSDNSQSVLANLVKSKSIQASASQATTVSSLNSNLPSPLGLTATQWQNPLLNNSPLNLDDLLHAPLLQNPSSNNKFALSQILTSNTEQSDGSVRIPLNWPERSGNDAALIRNLQNLLGHIEREQIHQMQSAEANQGNNPNQLQGSQQWVPLLINHQYQLQLIEFYINKEDKLDQAGEKKHHWFINLHFNLPVLGQLGIEISMFDNECNTTFWSESASTLNQLASHIQPLRERLTEQGIIVSDLQSRHGTLEKRKNNIQQRLVDIKT